MKDLGSNIVAKLTIVVQGKTISTLPISKGAKIVIGRGNEVHYQIKSGALSRKHCEIEDKGTHLELKDLESLNGTFVNQKKIQIVELKNGDHIQIGPISFQVDTIYGEIKESPPVSQDGSSTTFPGKSVDPQEKKELPKAPPSELTPESLHDLKTKKEGVPSRTDKKKGPLDGEKIKKVLAKKEFPAGPCVQCGKHLTPKDMSTHAGVFKDGTIYCIGCFCEGSGNFPTIAGYRIVKKMGGGGMGDVYEAIQLSMERPVAFKLMKGLENASDAQVRRFFREARTGGKLNHPNIVGFIDAGKLEGACFIAMEFIHGMDVRQIVDEYGPIHYLEALRIAYYVTGALDYANAKFNIVHRDVKPENILISYDYTVKLTDFGLAKNLEEAGLSGITKSQTGVGTLFYMAPEQISDARFADQRADIYSLGVSLYEMITASRPFVADQMLALVNKIRYEQPTPLPEMVPGIPPEVCQIIGKAMAKDAKDRYQTLKEMTDVLKPFVKE